MQYQVFVQSQSDHQFIASVVGVPNCVAEGGSKEEAIANAKTILEKKLAQGELVTIEIDSTEADSLLQMQYAGIFADDPTFDDWMEKLATIRHQANSADDKE
ncbi:MAG: type II toxin-antitoxin system HicB family antitoxin [Microcystaceae cyanobacterium]